jgi:uncharacterized membrane protein YdjX (TVP38/TMEM64 family)
VQETDNASKVKTKSGLIKNHGQKLIALLFWLVLIGVYQWVRIRNGLSPLQVVQSMLDFISQGLWGPLIFILLYALRPLILFPATLLTLAGGYVFGPVLGVFYTIIASNLSSTIAYFVGRYFGKDVLRDDEANNLIQRYAHRMRDNSFETVMIMRFIFLPYDAVSYLAGFLSIKFWPFITATALGSLPGTIAFVGFAASIESFTGVVPTVNPLTLGVSVGIFILSIALSRIFKKREGLDQ